MTSVAAHIPVLETERLRLRAQARRDREAHRLIMMSDRAVHMGGERTASEAWSAFASEIASWVLDGFGYWTVALRETDEAVAFVGLAKPDDFPEIELGWMTTAQGEGKGYAFEAAQAALDWAFGPRNLTTLVSYIDPQNKRSIALAKRLGASHDTAANGPETDDLVFRHPKRAA